MLPVATLMLSLFFTGCFTGIETTNKINLSKKDIETVKPSDEDRFLSDIRFLALKDWKPEKPFLITDDKFSILVEGPGRAMLHKGDTIFFKTSEIAKSAGGGESTRIIFDTRYGETSYPIEKDIMSASNSIAASDIALTIDLEIVNTVREKLKGQTVWTRSALWYDDSLNYKKGKKFLKVNINEVKPGNSFFPLLVEFSDEDNEKGSFLMNVGFSGNESRNFGKLFSLTDPKDNYKNISAENWSAIQSEKLNPGMTKEECRLSRGNPTDVDNGHNYSNTMEIWFYPDGSYLQFVDGLLVNFK